MAKLTAKQQRFADEYLIDCNATRAYKAAYPRVKSVSVAQANGSRMLLNAMVKSYIDARLAEISSEKVADAAEVVEYLTSVMRGESEAEVIVVVGVGDGRSSASRVTKAPDERERLKAAELLGKRYGIFTDKLDLVAPVTIVIEDDYGDG